MVAAIPLIVGGFAGLRIGPSIVPAVRDALSMAAGILLLVGLWTPFSGALAAITAIWTAISQAGDPWVSILLGSIGAALAIIGPGIWSVDARLFGWKRIDVTERKSSSLF